jgi:preprotein translocase SecF subunit
MFRLVQLRRYYYIFSTAIIIPGTIIMLYSLITTGSIFPLGIDFVGGSIYEVRFGEAGATEANIRDVFEANGSGSVSIQQIGSPDEYRWSIRLRTSQDPETTRQITEALNEIALVQQDSLRIESVSATVGAEASRAAFVAVLVATVVVTGFIVIAFRSVPNAFRYGMCAILAMFHDVLVVCSAASLLGLLFKWEVDALFLTAVLTVVGFSVQDTIVVFDRIRENIPRHIGEPYETIVNRSVLETLHRSLATQLNAFFIMIAILLFGGDSIKQFIFILFIGLLTGTYSSIFIAVPLLVSWEKGEIPFINRRAKAPQLQTSEG